MKGARSKAKKAPQKKSKPVTVEALVEQGNIAVGKMQPELAKQFFERALAISESDSNIMDCLADVHLQLGEADEALDLLLQSTELAPATNPFKWLYLAQLQCGHEALESYKNAIQMMTSLAETSDNQELITKQVCKAYCSIAELFLTDLCFDEGAELCCEDALNKACEVCLDSIDAQQTMASLRLSQNRPMEATEIMMNVYTRSKESRDKVRSRTIIQDVAGTDDEAADMARDCPDMDFSISTAKLLIECGSTRPDLIDCAVDLISDLLEEDDENIEIWYMMGVACMSARPADNEAARFHLERALEMMDSIMESTGTALQDFDNKDQYLIIKDHLAILDGSETCNNLCGAAEEGPETGDSAMPVSAAAGVEDILEDEEWSDEDD